MTENTKTAEDLLRERREQVEKTVERENHLKDLFVEYVGDKYEPEDGIVTVEMCIQAMAEDFPEFLQPLCEENYLLGYYQCEKDIQSVMEVTRALESPGTTEDE